MRLNEKLLCHSRFKQLACITLIDEHGERGGNATTIEIIRNCTESIEELSLMASQRISTRVFEVLAHCKKLHTFSFYLHYSSHQSTTGLQIKNKYQRPFHAQLLTSFKVYLHREEDKNKTDDITANIIRYGQELASLRFSDLKSFASKNIKRLIEGLPECELANVNWPFSSASNLDQKLY